MALLRPNQLTDGGSGSGSLRDRILQANSTPEDDIIELQGGETYTLSIENTITFIDENRGELGDLDIANNGTLTIRVVGEGQATIDASGIPEGDRVFDVQESANLTLENLIITGGNVLEDGAGGIGVRGNSVATINDSTISGNTASQDGGGVLVDFNGRLNLNNSIVENNTASEAGGGIAITSNATANISQSTINIVSKQILPCYSFNFLQHNLK